VRAGGRGWGAWGWGWGAWGGRGQGCFKLACAAGRAGRVSRSCRGTAVATEGTAEVHALGSLVLPAGSC
jgi:hypothetical protein